jgi:hypothetical protein
LSRVVISEQLPPSWVDAWSESDVGWSSIGLDLHCVILPLLRSDSLSLFIEEELLGRSVLYPSLNDCIVSTNTFHDSSEWLLWNKVEWSIDIESKFLVITLSSILSMVFEVDNVPFLVSTVMFGVNNNWLSFIILVSWYIKALLVLPIDEVLVLVSEQLPPIWVGAVDLHIWGSTWVLDIKWLVSLSRSDGQWWLMEVPDLLSKTILSLDD